MKTIRYSRTGARITLGAAVIMLGACAAGTAENCDALSARNIFQDAACKSAGGYAARTNQINASAGSNAAEARTVSRDTAATRTTTAAVSHDVAELRRQNAELRTDLARLRLQVNNVNARNEAEKAQVAALREQLAGAQRELDEASRSSGFSPEEAARLQASVDAKKKAVKKILGNIEKMN